VLGKLKKLKNHVIVCGLGATALQIIEDLETLRGKNGGKLKASRDVSYREYLAIDSSDEAVERIRNRWPRINCLSGDATDDDILVEAGIEDAYGIFPVLSSEKDNLYITMAARQLNPHIRIVARTADVVNIGKKLFKGGADSVVSPNLIGGLRIVSEMVRPHVTAFLDEMMRHEDTRSEMAEIALSPDCPLCGLSLKDAALPGKYGLLVIALKKSGDPFYNYNPSGDARMAPGDILVVIGARDQIRELTRAAAGG